MAEGFTNLLAGDQIEARSAGLEAHGKNPRAIAIMREAGVDISRQESKQITPALLHWADVVITVCGHADEHCPVVPPPKRKQHWPIPDPAKATGTEDEIRSAFHAVRDDIHSRVTGFVASLRQQRTAK